VVVLLLLQPLFMLVQPSHDMMRHFGKRWPCLRHVTLHVFMLGVLVHFFVRWGSARHLLFLVRVPHRSCASSLGTAIAGTSFHQPLATATALPCCASQHGDEVTNSAELQFTKELLCRQWNAPCEQDSVFWAVEEMNLLDDGLPRVGTVLLANPDVFLHDGFWDSSDDLQEGTPSAALRYTGWTRQEEEAQLPRRDRARWRLPVILIRHQDEAGAEGLVLDRWTGKLLGDLDPDLLAFQTRPLYLGYNEPPDEPPSLSMLHGYPAMPGATCIGEGLAFSNITAFGEACDWVGPEGPGSSLRFKFFYGFVKWSLTKAKRELSSEAGIWIPVRASTDMLLREPDSSFEEPLWVQLAERAGGTIAELARKHSLLAD